VAPSAFGGTDPTGVNPLAALTGPSGSNLLGTDQYGRSIYGELVYGTRAALEVGVFSTLLGGAVGSLIGIVGGYLGGWVDLIVMRLIDMLLALPGLLLALIFIAALPRTLTNEVFAIAISSIPAFARVLRSQAVQIRSRLFIDAVTVTGLRRSTIIARHVIPNCLAPAMELASVYVGVAIVIAASLSFLGLGPSEVVPDWGTLIQSGQGYIDHDWWISVFPGVAITLTVIAGTVIGDRIRDVTEPARG
jgi:peptide/nickel transport system permease protein